MFRKNKIKINLSQLKTRCLQTIPEITGSVPGLEEIRGKTNSCWYKDNGSNVLAVAHMDTVQTLPFFNWMQVPSDIVAYSPQLDDRLGVYTILDLLPVYGINVDVLLTEDEERCNSSAEHFIPQKKYNWVVEFDRGGSDLVHYDTASDDILIDLEGCGFTIGWGSYSDIASMSIDCSAFNVGIGYQGAHSLQSHMSVRDYKSQMKKFRIFYKSYKDKYFKYPEVQPRPMDDLFEDDNVGSGFWRKKFFPHSIGNRKDEVDKNIKAYVDGGNNKFGYMSRCPECGVMLDDDYCTMCGRTYSIDEMEAQEI